MTRRRDLLAVAVRIVTILSAVCVVGLGGARDGGTVLLESWDDQINNPTRFKALPVGQAVATVLGDCLAPAGGGGRSGCSA